MPDLRSTRASQRPGTEERRPTCRLVGAPSLRRSHAAAAPKVSLGVSETDCPYPVAISALLVVAGDNPPAVALGGLLCRPLRRHAAARILGEGEASSPQPRWRPAREHGAVADRHDPATFDERTRDYVRRRTTDGLSKREILRCLKRYIAREVFQALPRAALDRP